MVGVVEKAWQGWPLSLAIFLSWDDDLAVPLGTLRQWFGYDALAAA